MNHHHYHRQNGDFIDQEDHPITTTHPRRSSYGPNLTGNTVYQDVRERTRFNNRTEGMYFSCNGNESFRAVHPPEGIVADKYVATRPRNDYFDDVNPVFATYTRMGDVVDSTCHAAKPMTRHVVDVNPTYATHPRMGVVKNFGSVAKPVYGIQDESNVSDSNHTHARVATTRHSSIIPQTRLLGGVHFQKTKRRCMDSFTNQS